MSTRDIDRGALGSRKSTTSSKTRQSESSASPKKTRIGRAILFETGALAKGLKFQPGVYLLIDLNASDVEDPLAQFNHTLPTQTSLWSLVRTLNSCLGAIALDERVCGTSLSDILAAV